MNNNYGYPQQFSAINRPIYNTQPIMPASNQNATPRVRPVSSLDEVRAMSVDFDGSVFYFPDYANRRIYTKQINMDGTASINMYELKELPNNSQGNNVDFITRNEFNNALSQIKEAFSQLTQVQTNINPQSQQQQNTQPPTEQINDSKPQFNF